jgi:hypothetical protein
MSTSTSISGLASTMRHPPTEAGLGRVARTVTLAAILFIVLADAGWVLAAQPVAQGEARADDGTGTLAHRGTWYVRFRLATLLQEPVIDCRAALVFDPLSVIAGGRPWSEVQAALKDAPIYGVKIELRFATPEPRFIQCDAGAMKPPFADRPGAWDRLSPTDRTRYFSFNVSGGPKWEEVVYRYENGRRVYLDAKQAKQAWIAAGGLVHTDTPRPRIIEATVDLSTVGMLPVTAELAELTGSQGPDARGAAGRSSAGAGLPTAGTQPSKGVDKKGDRKQTTAPGRSTELEATGVGKKPSMSPQQRQREQALRQRLATLSQKLAESRDRANKERERLGSKHQAPAAQPSSSAPCPGGLAKNCMALGDQIIAEIETYKTLPYDEDIRHRERIGKLRGCEASNWTNCMQSHAMQAYSNACAGRDPAGCEKYAKHLDSSTHEAKKRFDQASFDRVLKAWRTFCDLKSSPCGCHEYGTFLLHYGQRWRDSYPSPLPILEKSCDGGCAESCDTRSLNASGGLWSSESREESQRWDEKACKLDKRFCR